MRSSITGEEGTWKAGEKKNRRKSSNYSKRNCKKTAWEKRKPPPAFLAAAERVLDVYLASLDL